MHKQSTPQLEAEQTASLSDRVANAIFWNTIAFPIKAIIKFASGLVLVWFFTREQYGLYQGAVGSVVAGVWVYTSLGVSAALLKFIPEIMTLQGSRGVVHFLRRILALRLTLLLLVIGLLNIFGQFIIDTFNLGADGLFLIRAASGIIVLRAITDTCGRLLAAVFRQKTTNALDIISALIQPLLVIILVAPVLGFDLGIRGAVYALLIGATVDMLLALRAGLYVLRQMPTMTHTTQHVPHMWKRFSLNAIMNYIMDLSINVTSPDFVALFLLWLNRPGTLGDIEVAWNQVLIVLTYLVMPLNGIYVPMFSEIFAKKELQKLANAYATLTRTLLLLIVPAGVGFIVLVPQAFTLIGIYPKFSQSVGIAQILIGCLFLESIVVVPHVILMVHEQYRIVLASRVLALLATPLIIWSVLSSNGYLIAVALGGARLFSRLILTPYAVRRYHLRFPWRFTGRLLIPALGCAATVQGLALILPVVPHAHGQNTIHVVLLVGAGMMVFWGGFRLLGGLEAEDRQRLSRMRVGRLLLKFV